VKLTIQHDTYDTLLLPTDWRFSAAITGIYFYFEFQGDGYEKISYDKGYRHKDSGFTGIAYKQEDIQTERFLKFAESFFAKEFSHIKAQHLMAGEKGWDKEQLKEVNDALTANTILKKVIGKHRFDGNNQAEIQALLDDNRIDIIRETFRNKKNLYANYANPNLMFSGDAGPNLHCRLKGFNVDGNRKSKETTFQFNLSGLNTTDIPEFDFIPFSFTNSYESFFINNNTSIEALIQTARTMQEILAAEYEKRPSDRVILMNYLEQAADFIDFDVEVIVKNRAKDYYETMFIRKPALSALIAMGDVSALNFRCELGKDYWLNVQEEVYERCLNQLYLDDLIELMLKLRISEDNSYISYVAEKLISLNIRWKENLMNKEELIEKIELARKCGYLTAKKLVDGGAENKRKSYRTKLTSALVFHDYDRVNEILLQLSAYSEISYPFAYALFEDGEKHKDIAFAFVNALEISKKIPGGNQ